MRTTLILALVCAAAIAAAQAPSAAGTWIVAGEAAGAQTDGGTWNQDAVTGTLVVDQQGDALTGTWGPEKRPPLAFTGQITGGTFEIRTDVRDVPVSINGERSMMRMRWTFRGSAEGDTLKGTLSLHREEETEPTPLQPFTAKRSK